MSRNTATVTFQALELKGSLLPASLLEEVSKLNRPKELLLEGHDYGLSRGERLRDRIDAAWVLTKELWDEYGNLRERAGHSTAGLHFGLRLLKEVFGWSGVEPCHGWQHGESRYPITHRAFGGAVPLILRGIEAGDLDRGSKQFGQDERKRSPHSCLQECLNADDSANWGVLLSGDRLRLLHDNPSLVKPAYLAADLELMIEGERFDEFSVLWLLLHASRFQHPKTGNCVLDDWKQKAEESGERVLGALRGGVQSALESLGWGFLNHPANGALREALQSGQLSRQQFHEQLLRLVYRFLFLFTAEDRDLLFPRELKADDPRRRIYREGYSVSRLRELAIKRSAYEGEYGDLWELQRLVFQQLSIGNSPLGLPGLGGLFSLEQCPDLQAAELWNGPLLRAIKAIGWFDAGGSFTRVRYRDLNTEELGSVYEGLLELHPQLEQQGSQWQLSYGGGAGSDRKTTGSYYTPDALVQELIKSALIPVIDDRLSKAHGQAEQEQALLNIKVIDPACGSGHFLLAAARRLAVALAQVRAGDDQPSEDDRQHALRDVVAHCIYAVDRNPMAVELCKVALWIEAIDPGKPLSFLDAHIQCGDSLVGVFDPKVLEEGIPDEAYKPLTGDNKTVCTSLLKDNTTVRKTISRRGTNRGIQGSLDLSGTPPRSHGQQALQTIEAMPETTLAETVAKQAAYIQWLADRGRDPETLAADLYTAAFFLPKTSDSRAKVPTTEHLLKLLSGQLIGEEMEEAVSQAAQNFRFFHWHLRFGEVMTRGGFDCVIGNPPWEKFTVLEREFFSGFPSITTEANATKRRKAIEIALEQSSALSREWDHAQRESSAKSEFVRSSCRFTDSAVGELNLYPLFADLSISLTKQVGRSGLILKSLMFTGSTWKIFTDKLITTGRLYAVYDFKNWEMLFKAIGFHERYSLATMGPLAPDSMIQLAVGLTNPAQINDDSAIIHVDRSFPRRVNPETGTLPQCETPDDLRILSRAAECFPTLGQSTWSARYSRGLDMTGDAGELVDRETLEAKDFVLHKSWFTHGEIRFAPVYEGKLIHQYDHRFATFDGIAAGKRFGVKAATINPTVNEKLSRDFEIVPRYWVSCEFFQENTNARRINGDWNIAFRDTTNVISNFRTAVGCIVGAAAFNYKCPNIIIRDGDPELSALFLSLFNSTPYDYLLRQKFYGANLTKSMLMQSFVVPPEKLAPYKSKLLDAVASLTNTSHSVLSFCKAIGREHLCAKSLDERLEIRAWIDALYFHLFGFCQAEVNYVYETFPIWRDKSIEAHGCFLEKEKAISLYLDIATDIS